MAATPGAKPIQPTTPAIVSAPAAAPATKMAVPAQKTTIPQVAPVAKAAAATAPQGFNASNVMKMPGMEKYAKPAVAKPANFSGGPTGYSSMNTTFKQPAVKPAKQQSMAETKSEDSKIGGRYTPAEFDAKLARIKARHQANPANTADLAARLQAAYKKQKTVAESRQQRKSLLKQILKG